MYKNHIFSIYKNHMFSIYKNNMFSIYKNHKLYPSSYIVLMFLKCTCSGLIDSLIQAQVLILWGFLNTLIKFLSMVWVWMGGIIGRLIFKIEILEFRCFIYPCWHIFLNMGSRNGLNGIAVARFGLILKHNEATGSRKLSRYLRGLRDTI